MLLEDLETLSLLALATVLVLPRAVSSTLYVCNTSSNCA